MVTTSTSGVHYNWKRYYDPGTGRYTQVDPIGFSAGDANLYRYAFNEPIEVIDPTGEIVPLVLAAWGVVELGLSIYDIVNTGQTLLDPCASGREKATTLAMAGLGIILPGGGYSKLSKTSELIATHGRRLSRREFSLLRESIAKVGIKEPIKYIEVNGKRYIVDGHHRWAAAQQLGMETVPTQAVQLPYKGYRTNMDLFDFEP